LQCVAVVLHIYSYLIEVAGEAAEEFFSSSVLPCVAVCCRVLPCVAVVLHIYSYLIEVAGEAAEEFFRIDAGLPEKSAVV